MVDYVSHLNPHTVPFVWFRSSVFPVSRRDVHTPGLPASIPCHPHSARRRSGLYPYCPIPTSKSISFTFGLVAEVSTLRASHKMALPHLSCMDPAQRPWVAGVLNGSFSLHSTRQCGPLYAISIRVSQPPRSCPIQDNGTTNIQSPTLGALRDPCAKLRLQGHIQCSCLT